MSELIISTDKTPAQIIASDEEFEAFYRKIREEIETHPVDTSTKNGRKAIASLAHKVARTKTAIDDAGKALIEDANKIVNSVNESRRRAREKFDALKAEVRQPLTDWEEADEARVAKYEGLIKQIEALGATYAFTTAIEGQGRLDQLNLYTITPEWGEFEAKALRLKAEGIEQLKMAIAQKTKAEAEAAELAKLRAEKDERERLERERIAKETAERKAKEAAEIIAQEAIEKERAAAQAKIDEAERLRLKAENDHLNAIREDVEAKLRAEAAANDERRRREMRELYKKDMQKKADEKRLADKEYRDGAFTAAADAIIQAGHIGRDNAEAILKAIEAGNVPHVQMKL